MGVLVLREAMDVPIWLVDAQENEIRVVWPLRLISNRFNNHKTSTFHKHVSSEI
jgi:hypothetical protein